MKCRKMLRRALSLITALSTLFIFSPFALAATTEAAQAAAFDALPDDAIVCHVLGIPVYKYEVDENGYIDKDFSQALVPATYSTTNMTGTIPSGHRNETIAATVIHVYTGYSERNYISYCHAAEATALANGFTAGNSRRDLIIDALGEYGSNLLLDSEDPESDAMFAAVSLVITAGLAASNETRSQLANNILSSVATAGHAMIIRANSQYGNFYTSQDWNGLTVYRTGTYTVTGGTITVNSVLCGCGSLW